MEQRSKQRSKNFGSNPIRSMLLHLFIIDPAFMILILLGATLLRDCLLGILECIFAVPLKSDTVLIDVCNDYAEALSLAGAKLFLFLSLLQTWKIADLLQIWAEQHFPRLAERQEWQCFIKRKIMQKPLDYGVFIIMLTYPNVMVIVSRGIDPALYPLVFFMSVYAWFALLGQGLIFIIFRKNFERVYNAIKFCQRDIEKITQEENGREESDREKGD